MLGAVANDVNLKSLVVPTVLIANRRTVLGCLQSQSRTHVQNSLLLCQKDLLSYNA